MKDLNKFKYLNVIKTKYKGYSRESPYGRNGSMQIFMKRKILFIVLNYSINSVPSY